jgi:predicted Zn-dependent protease
MQYWVIVATFFCAAFVKQTPGEPVCAARWCSEKEKALGAALAAQLRKEVTPVAITSLNQYIESLTEALAPHMPLAQGKWNFIVIREPKGGSTFEPVALPGGYVFIPARLILACENEAELAGMLAHVMAHVVLQHGVIRRSNAGATDPAMVPLIYLGSVGLAGDDDDGHVPASYQATRRQDALDADQLAVRTLAAAGYDPHALLNYARRLFKGSNFERRITNLEGAMTELPIPPSAHPDASFRSAQAMVRNALATTRAIQSAAGISTLR